MRTSETHPLRVDPLPVGNGLLGLTFCPGKRGDSVYGAPWARDLKTDLTAIRDWGATIIVTLMERFEFDLLGVPDLPEKVISADMGWTHLPIRDVDVPSDPFEAVWPDVRADRWSGLGALVLEAAYEATLHAAVLNATSGGSRRVLLTRLGGGAFGNDERWITRAILRALTLFRGHELEVLMVSYGPPSREIREVEAAWAGAA